MGQEQLIQSKACDGKRRYTSWSAAMAHSARLRAEEGAAYNAYRCIVCGGIHVGHTPSVDTLQRQADMLRGLDA